MSSPHQPEDSSDQTVSLGKGSTPPRVDYEKKQSPPAPSTSESSAPSSSSSAPGYGQPTTGYDPAQAQPPYGQSSGSSAYGQPDYDQQQYGQQQYGQQQYGQPPQPQYGPPDYSPQQYGQQAQPQYGSPDHGQSPYPGSSYDQGAYGSYPQQAGGYPQQPSAYPAYGAPPAYPVSRGTNTMAILALIFGILVAPLGLVFGFIARSQIKKTGEEGDGLALAGIIIGGIFTLLIVAYIVFIVVIFAALAGSVPYSR